MKGKFKRKVRLFKKRWKSESPSYFKRITNNCLKAVGIASGILLISPMLPFALPTLLLTGCGYVVSIGTSMGIISKLVVKDPKDLEEVLNETNNLGTKELLDKIKNGSN